MGLQLSIDTFQIYFFESSIFVVKTYSKAPDLMSDGCLENQPAFRSGQREF